MSVWLIVGAWSLVVAVAVGAHLFGRSATSRTPRKASDTARRRARVGVAVSNAGPLLVLVVGLVTAYSTGLWVEVALGTTVAIILVAGIGFFLAPY